MGYDSSSVVAIVDLCACCVLIYAILVFIFFFSPVCFSFCSLFSIRQWLLGEKTTDGGKDRFSSLRRPRWFLCWLHRPTEGSFYLNLSWRRLFFLFDLFWWPSYPVVLEVVGHSCSIPNLFRIHSRAKTNWIHIDWFSWFHFTECCISYQ